MVVGTEDDPFQHSATITLNGHPRSIELPIYGAKVLAVRDAILDLHGKDHVVSWTRLEEPAEVGATSVTLQEAVTWEDGDQFLIATTGGYRSQGETETRTISSVSEAGTKLHFLEPLEYKHDALTVSSDFSGTTAEIEVRAEVGLLSHNVRVRGSNNKEWGDKIEKCPDGFKPAEFATQVCFQGKHSEEIGSDQHGAHIIMHGSVKNSGRTKGRLSNMEVTYAGQAFRLGRYPVHFHLNGDMTGSYVRNSAIHHTFNRAVNIHGSHNVLVKQNVGYNIMGGAFFLEDGVETQNTFDENLAVKVKPSSSLLNEDTTPAAFWVTHPNNIVINNVAAGCYFFGFWYRLLPTPTGPSFTNDINPQREEFGEFHDNFAHSIGRFGLWVFEGYFPPAGTGGARKKRSTDSVATFQNFGAYGCDKGAECVKCGNIQFNGLRLLGHVDAALEYKALENVVLFDKVNGPAVRDAVIWSYDDALPNLPKTRFAFSLPFGNGMVFDDVKLANFDQPGSAVFKMSEMQGTCSHHCGGWQVETSRFDLLRVTKKIHFGHWNEYSVVDTDGTFVGIASTIVPTTGTLPHSSSCVDAGEAFNVGLPASRCTGTSFHRFALNNAVPNGMNGRDFIANNDYGEGSSIFRDKSETHMNGWELLLSGNSSYEVYFEFAEQLTNFSYTGTIYGLNNEWIILKHHAIQPDKFSCDGNFYDDVGVTLNPEQHFNGDWHWEDNMVYCLVSSRVRDGKSITPGNSFENAAVDRPVKLESKKCYFTGCEKPKPASERERPDPPSYWSHESTWTYLEDAQKNEDNKPKSGTDLTIRAEDWVVLDEAIPPFNILTVFGVIEFEDGDIELRLEAAAILVYGRLLVGEAAKPYQQLASIVLTGSHDSEEYIVEGGPAFGIKSMGVYGRLDLHGKVVETSWTSLASTANKGTRVLNLAEKVDWEVGWQVLVSSTAYHGREREIRTINQLSGDGKSITLNGELDYTHLFWEDSFGDGRGYSFSAKVAALYRNIQVMGNNYAKTEEESFGARLFVASASGPDPNNADNSLFYDGKAQIENVMFDRCGQEGFTDPYDPRYCLSFINVNIPTDEEGKKSWVRNNVFKHSYSTAVGIYGTNKLLVQDNVIEHSVGSALIAADSAGVTLLGNLITTVLNVGTYLDRFEPKNIDVEFGIDLTDADDAVANYNVIAGTERGGIRHKGNPCDEACRWVGNEVHACMLGLATFLGEDTLVDSSCVKFCGSRIFRCIEYSLYYNNEASLVMDDFVSFESGVGLMALVIGPSATEHEMADKKVTVQNSIFVGNSAAFDCEGMKIDWKYDNLEIMTQARSMAQSIANGIGPIGVITGTFNSGSNEAPRKPWANIMAYNAIRGLTELKGNIFSDFNTKCGTQRGFAVAASKSNDDLIHETILEDSELVRTPEENLALIPEPNLGKINPSDCVDMDCDGLKKVMFRDLDGSFFGQVGTVLSWSDRWWDDSLNKNRGLGDYRIPKMLLTNNDGSRKPVKDVAKHRGIVRGDDCIYNANWQAVSCQNMEFVMLVIESMDEDTEMRRLSPLAIVNGPKGDEYLDLVNGPQDHGWCAGYTCQRRLSLFHVIIDARYMTTLAFTSNPPQVTRLMALNTDKAFVVSIMYIDRYRLDVFADDTFIYPKNSRLTGDGQFEYTDNANCIPTVEDPPGSNCVKDNFMYVVMKGSVVLRVVTTPQVVVGFKFMSTTDFFGEDIVENLAVFLGIPPEKIRVVNIISESRKKRDTMYVKYVNIECGDAPEETEDKHLTQAQLDTAAAKIINGMLLNNLPVGPENSEPLSVRVVEAAPPVSSEAWAEIEPDTTPLTVSKAGSMSFYEPAVPGREGQPFPTPMRLRVYDDSGAPITAVGSTANPWQVQATLVKGAGSHVSAALAGTTLVSFKQGWANFTDLYISYAGEDYTIEFTVVYPSTANFSLTSPDIVVPQRDMLVHMNMTEVVLEDTPVTLSLGLMDKDTGLHVDNVDWKGHTWSVTAAIEEGSLGGTTTVNIDAGTGLATFSDLQFNEIGHYYVTLVVMSDPAEYIVTHKLLLEVTNQELEDEPKEKTSMVEVKADADFDAVESPKDVAKFATKWAIKNKDKAIKITNIAARAGSIVATMEVQGRTSNVNNVLGEMCDEIEDGEVYMFGGKYTSLEPYMKIDGNMAYGVSCGPVPKKNELHPGIIAAIVIAALIVIAIIAILIFWRCYIVPKNKTYDTRTDMPDSTRDLRFLTANGRYNIEDYLFREKTLNNIKNQVPAQSAPMDTTGTTFSLNVESRLDMYDDRPVSARSAASLPNKMPVPSE